MNSEDCFLIKSSVRELSSPPSPLSRTLLIFVLPSKVMIQQLFKVQILLLSYLESASVHPHSFSIFSLGRRKDQPDRNIITTIIISKMISQFVPGGREVVESIGRRTCLESCLSVLGPRWRCRSRHSGLRRRGVSPPPGRGLPGSQHSPGMGR